MSNLSDYLEIAKVKEVPHYKSDIEMVNEIIKDHKIILHQMATVIEKANQASDEGTIDLIGGYIRELEKSSWMLDAWSKNTSDHLNNSVVNL